MNRLTLAALAAAATVSAVALTDAVTHGLTGRPSVFTDGGPDWAYYVATVSHGVLFALLAAVLVRDAARIDVGRSAVRWTRRLLVVLLVMLAVPFVVGIVVRIDDAPQLLGALGTAAFVLAFPVSAVLGILLLRRPEMRPGAALLAGVAVAFVLTFGLGALGSDWAHPAYPEVLMYLGVALLGRTAPVTQAVHRGRTSEPSVA
ncbi:hypothetical protein [Georgenia subflava]|uniref:DUF998 domain-containing protein n=1 Tax=Georgenia subflava TaxID=1622177 RepID=A0A6N7EV31_9MICO|nr:hypothetical protein [Georgenia subflava]MPV38994.1 hypothetical protein [Georgenia subflava]